MYGKTFERNKGRQSVHYRNSEITQLLFIKYFKLVMSFSTPHNSAWNYTSVPLKWSSQRKRIVVNESLNDLKVQWILKRLMLLYDYTTWWIVSQSLKFKILYQYGWREEREESKLLNYIPVAQPKKCMFKVNNISAMYKVCSTLIIRHQDIDEVTLPFV